MNNYERITAKIAEAIAGDLPAWRKPWRTLRGQGCACVPVNAISGRAYRGINVALLWGRQDADMRYLTFNQAKAAGGSVRKGEHGTQIVFWQKRQYIERTESGEERNKSSFLLKVYTVFNVAQCEGIKLPGDGKAPVPPMVPPMQEVYDKLGATVTHGGDRAAYSPGADRIVMPVPEAFTDADAYSATALHELTHWTGHDSRLARKLDNRFGDKAYAAEELVAELGSAFLCAQLGINCALEHHASYIQNWRSLLTEDSRAVFTAASKAQAAADYITSRAGILGAEELDNTEEEAA